MAQDNPIEPSVAPSGTGCAECLATGGWWFHLRRCAACGHVGCCDSSPSQHASGHARDSRHPIVQSYEPGEDWFWDYSTEQLGEGPVLAPPHHHPLDSPFRGRPVACRRTGRGSCADVFGRTYGLPLSDPGPRRVQKPLPSAAIVVLVGIAIGALTLVGQAVLDPDWNRLANSGAIWVTGAFLMGSLMPLDRGAAAAGFGTLIGAVVSYYLVAQVVAGAGVSASSLAIWLPTAVVGGPVFGIAGHWWRGLRQPQRLLGSRYWPPSMSRRARAL